MQRGIVVFSAMGTQLLDRVARQLRSVAIDSSFVKYTPNDISGYFDRLVTRTLEVVNSATSNPDVRLSGLLVSCAQNAEERQRERAAFFPSMRRVELPAIQRNDVNVANSISGMLISTVKSQVQSDFSNKVSPRGDARYLLPIRNCGVKEVLAAFDEIYERRREDFGNAFSKKVMHRRGGRGFRVNDLDFLPANNGERHPVRRQSDTRLCDLNGALRFGVQVPDRFEFDVTCEGGLSGKTFDLCDGRSQRIQRGTDHLNMRINDDYGEGRKQ